MTAMLLDPYSLVSFRLVHQTRAMQRKVNQSSDFDNAEWCQERDIAAQRLGVRPTCR